MGLSVIGAGLGRTGTMTMKLALEQLGFGPCHHMLEVIQNPPTAALWEAAADGAPDWDALLGGYRAAVDWPSVAFYRDLADLHPEAKVILTVRDPDAWFRSTQATIFGFPTDGPPTPFSTMLRKLMARFTSDLKDRDGVIAAFNAHNAEVRRVIAPGRLLVYEARQGWEPLCAFLGVPVPDAPMPHVNTTEDFQKHTPPGTQPGDAKLP